MYLVTESQDKDTEPEGTSCLQTPPQNFYHYIHALDLSSSNFLNETAGGPVQIAPTAIGGAAFQSKTLLQRPGILFLNGAPTPNSPTVYMAFSMMDGTRPNPSGWVLAFDGGNLPWTPAQLSFATTPGNADPNHRRGGGVWMGGAGLAAGQDATGANSIFVSTADGQYDGSVSGNYGDSFLKLSTDLRLSDYFTPADWDYRWNQTCNRGNGWDLDLGSAGTMLVPDGTLSAPYGHIAIKGDKESNLWVLDRTTLGGAGTGCTPGSCTPCQGTNPAGVLQQFAVAGTDAKTTPAFWFDGTTPFMYVGQHNTQVSQYKLNCTNPGPICSPAASVTNVNETMGYTPTVSISSNGTTSGTGIAWAIKSSSTGTDTGLGLYAFNAENLATTLYAPTNCPNRDAIGPTTKFSVPTVANGYVFVGTQTDFDIFGTGAETCN